jgi:hypothetical protein
MLQGQENGNVEFASDRFRVKHQSTHPPHLFIIDCETRRFTIEQLSSAENFAQWCREVDHAVTAGRHIVCVPINDNSIEEIESLGVGLGYALWPPMTILAPPPVKPVDELPQLAASGGAKIRREDELRLRQLAKLRVP